MQQGLNEYINNQLIRKSGFSPYYDPEEIDETDLLKLYDLMGTLNCYEFSGQGHKIKDLISDDDLKLIEKYKNSYAEGLFKISTFEPK